MNKRIYLRYMLGSLALLVSCSQDEPSPVQTYDVPTEVQIHVNNFIAEAKARGRDDITIDNLVVEYETNLNNGDAAGICTYPFDDNPPHIRLDTTSASWQNNYWSREALIFHELGHCILNRRSHRDDVMLNGNYASLMRTRSAQFFGESLNYFKREYYLDELFDESTSAPGWTNSLPEYNSIPNSNRSELYVEEFNQQNTDWSLGSNSNSDRRIENGVYRFESLDDGAYLSTNNIIFDSSQDFEIETSLRIVQGDNAIMLQWGGSRLDNHFFFGYTPNKYVFLGQWTTQWPSGISAGRNLDQLSPDEFNKITIRKIGNEYFFYVNETLFDNARFEDFEGNSFGFYVGSFATIEIDYLKVNSI